MKIAGASVQTKPIASAFDTKSIIYQKGRRRYRRNRRILPATGLGGRLPRMSSPQGTVLSVIAFRAGFM
jgi:hypothetical protein